MQYNLDGIKRRIADIEGGMTTVASEMGISNRRIYKLLDGTTNPRLSTMLKLNATIKKFEGELVEAAKNHPEIFLPDAVSFGTSCLQN